MNSPPLHINACTLPRRILQAVALQYVFKQLRLPEAFANKHPSLWSIDTKIRNPSTYCWDRFSYQNPRFLQNFQIRSFSVFQQTSGPGAPAYLYLFWHKISGGVGRWWVQIEFGVSAIESYTEVPNPHILVGMRIAWGHGFLKIWLNPWITLIEDFHCQSGTNTSWCYMLPAGHIKPSSSHIWNQ